jgi:hypothetical protein
MKKIKYIAFWTINVAMVAFLLVILCFRCHLSNEFSDTYQFSSFNKAKSFDEKASLLEKSLNQFLETAEFAESCGDSIESSAVYTVDSLRLSIKVLRDGDNQKTLLMNREFLRNFEYSVNTNIRTLEQLHFKETNPFTFHPNNLIFSILFLYIIMIEIILFFLFGGLFNH